MACKWWLGLLGLDFATEIIERLLIKPKQTYYPVNMSILSTRCRSS